MKYRQFIFILIAVATLLYVSCGERYDKDLESAEQLAPNNPDSAISILDNIDHSKLSKRDEAKYALIYTMAQDKSGLDVSSDSLIGIAYHYYGQREQDSLYAKCEYYMGIYYMLNDSTEQALNCFEKSANHAKLLGDAYTQSLALERMAKLINATDPVKSVAIAREALRVYSSIPNASVSNIIYFKLSLCMALFLSDSIKSSENECNEAIKMSVHAKDSFAISDAYLDATYILRRKGDFSDALETAKKSCDFDKSYNTSRSLNLAWAYIDADSIDQCLNTLSKIRTDKPFSLYTLYYIRHLAAIKNQNYPLACQYADSAYNYLENMYSDQLRGKENYYMKLVMTQHEQGVTEGKSNMLRWLTIIAVISATIILIFVVHSYNGFKRSAKLQLQIEVERRLAEEHLHEKEIRDKEIQLSTMRGFILKKVDIAKKLEEIKGEKEKSIILTEEDWEEIRLFVDNVERDFVVRLEKTFPNLEESDIRLFMLLRLKLPTKALALIYNISEKSIKQKLFVDKSKVGIEGQGRSLRKFIEAF